MDSRTSTISAGSPSSISSLDAGITRRRRGRRVRRQYGICVDGSESEKENRIVDETTACVKTNRVTVSTNVTNNNSNNNYDEHVRQFQTAAQATSQAAFWTKGIGTTLMKHVVTTSMTSLLNNNLSSLSLLLEDHATEILSSCRILVKEATEEDKLPCDSKNGDGSSSKSSLQYSRLFVAIHGLRALLSTSLLNVDTSSKRDAILRLLYFCIVSASTTTIEPMRDVHCLCFLAYHAFAQILLKYILSSSDTFYVCTIGMADKQLSPSPDRYLNFPIPILQTKKPKSLRKNESTKNDATSNDQICTMCVAATLAVARTVLRQVKDGSSKEENDENKNTFFQLNDPIAIIRYLILHATVPWITTMAELCCVNSKLEKQHQSSIVSYCKKAHRILSETADTIHEHTEDRLQLQKDSLCALMLDYDILRSTAVHTILWQHKIYDSACSFAWKVAESYYDAVIRNDTTKTTLQIPLDSFHIRVGTLLDSFSESVVPHSMPYIEYCAYRAVHTTSNGYQQRCADNECTFHYLPYFYRHQCSSRQTLNYNESFLAFFFLAQQVRYCLEQCMSHENVTSPTLESSTMYHNTIISEFRRHFVNGKEVNSVTLLRLYNLVSLLSLHRVVYRITQHESACIPHELLDVVGRILTDCIGPFCLGLLEIADEKQRRQIWSVIASCLQQAITTSELHNAINPKRANALTEETTRTLLQIAKSKLQPRSECIDNTAKVRNNQIYRDFAIAQIFLTNAPFPPYSFCIP
jgi:hypothetical protein